MTIINDLLAEEALQKRSLRNLQAAWAGMEDHDAGNWELRRFLTTHIAETKQHLAWLGEQIHASCPF